MALTREEYEVSVVMCWGEELMTVTVSDPKYYRHMIKMGAEPTITNVDKEGDKVSWVFKVPSEWFKAPRPKRKMSEEQRQASSERMKARFANEDEEEGED